MKVALKAVVTAGLRENCLVDDWADDWDEMLVASMVALSV